MRYLFAVLLLPLLTILPAQPLYAWTAAEIRTMPPYCAGRYAQHDNPAEFNRWMAMYGQDFIHTHHLCHGIGYLDRYFKVKSQAEKKTALNDAMGNLNYMVQHASPEFKLMPDVYLYRSQAFNLMNKPGEAIADLRKAIALDPKYARAYTQAAEYLERSGQRDEALKLVTDGLRQLPESSSLKRVYTRLGGALPYPEPSSKAEPNLESLSPDQSRVAPEKLAERKSAVFDFGRRLRGGRNVLPEAGANVLVEIREHPADPKNKVRFTISSRVPVATARINRIGIDMGQHAHLFKTVQVDDPYLGKYYPLQRPAPGFAHAFWPNFRPAYMAEFTIDPKERKKYDPREIPPGGSLTLVGTLAPGKQIDDVFSAMKHGLHSEYGLRFAVIVHYTRGFNPGTATLEDDSGFITSGIRQMTGFERDQALSGSDSDSRPGPSVSDQKDPQRSASTATDQDATRSAPAGADGDDGSATVTPPAIGSPTNPWCRFCP